MKITLWDRPYNGGWIWFDRGSIRRFSCGKHKSKYWWAILGFCGSIYLQTWPKFFR